VGAGDAGEGAGEQGVIGGHVGEGGVAKVQVVGERRGGPVIGGGAVHVILGEGDVIAASGEHGRVAVQGRRQGDLEDGARALAGLLLGVREQPGQGFVGLGRARDPQAEDLEHGGVRCIDEGVDEGGDQQALVAAVDVEHVVR